MHTALSLSERFAKFDAAHPDVWQSFVSVTRDLIAAGKTRYSADAILHVVRWHRATSTAGQEFKINNNFSACYARKWADTHKDAAGFFATRVSQADASPDDEFPTDDGFIDA
jgi:hypothetical protein